MSTKITVEDLVVGTGLPVRKAMDVTAEIRVFLNHGDEVPGCYPDGPHAMLLARRDHPPGVVLGMVGMRPGGVRRIRVPPGPAENHFVMIGKVPPNAVLVYEVTLHSIHGEEYWLRLDRQSEAAGGPSGGGDTHTEDRAGGHPAMLRRLRPWLIVAAATALVVYGGSVVRAYRQAALNQELMRALVAMNGTKAEDLLRSGADANARPHWPLLPSWRLLWDCRRGRLPVAGLPLLFQMVVSRRAPMVPVLLRYGADPNAGGNAGSTPLIRAVRVNGDLATAHELLSHGADPNARNASGMTALCMAVAHSCPDMAGLLLQHGADRQAADLYGVGPLQLAAMNRSAATLRVLLKAGLDRDAMDSAGRTALMRAAAPGSDDPAKVTTDSTGHLSWPADAELPPDPKCIQVLLGAGADPTIRNKDLDTARDLAASDQARNMLQRAEADWRKKHAR
jgi:hypothetical protein